MSKAFFEALTEIVGQDNAARYAKKFGDFDAIFHDDITNAEALAFYAYTTGMEWYQIINAQLWSETPATSVIAFAETLNSGLAKLRPYTANKGVVYRGYSTEITAEFRSKYTPQAVVTFPGFTSASFHAQSAFGGNVLFTIRSLNARVIWFMAADYHEHEVLFPTNCHFRVLDKEAKADRIAILLEEMP